MGFDKSPKSPSCDFLQRTDSQYVILTTKKLKNVDWDFKNPQNPHGEPPKSPSYCITDIPIQAAGQKTQIGIMKFLLISEYPASLPPNTKNSTYPSQAGAIGIILIMRIIFSFRYHKDTAFWMSNVSFAKKITVICVPIWQH